MNLLPVEIWEQIIKIHVHNDTDWLALSTTSSAFRALAQEALFANVTLSRDLEYEESKYNTRLALFVRSVVDHPRLAASVRSLALGSYQSEIGSQVPYRFSNNPLLPHLSSFSTLRRLRVDGFVIDADFCDTLRSHPCLTTVVFISCNVDHTLLDRTNQDFPLANAVSNVIIDRLSPSSAAAWAAVVPQQPRFLDITNLWDFESIVTLLSSIQTLRGTSALTTLCITNCEGTISPDIVLILVSCPQIRRLSFDLCVPTESPLYSLPQNAIPLLEEFNGPASLSETFIQGRPVHTVILLFIEDAPNDILQSLHLSTAPVVNLEVPIFTDLNPDKYCSYLACAPDSILCFSLSGYFKVMEHMWLFLPTLSLWTHLRVVQFLGVYFPLSTPAEITETASADPWQTEVVRRYSEACPSIREFCFKSERERWLARKDGGWERFFSS